MRILAVFLGLLLFCGLAGTASADIYSWTDAAGVRHFSNHVPPKSAGDVEITSETAYVAPSEEERLAAQQAEQLAEAQQKIDAMEAERKAWLNTAEREIEADRQDAEKALQEAEAKLKAAEAEIGSVHKHVVYSGYFPNYRRMLFHRKELVHSPLGAGHDLHKKRFESRKGISGPMPRQQGNLDRLNQPRLNRGNSPGGFPAESRPDLLLRVR